MKYAILTVLLALSTTNCYAQNTYVTDLDIAKKLSEDTKQNILLIFSAEWCHNCDNLKNDLPEMSFIDNKIVCILDFDSHKKLARKLNIKNIPTSISIINQEQEKSRMVGYDKAKYIEWLKKISQ